MIFFEFVKWRGDWGSRSLVKDFRGSVFVLDL